MANYKQVSYGSQGGDVTELRKLLNKNGYNLAEGGALTKAQSGSSNATQTETKAPTSDNVAAGGVNSAITAAGGEPPAKTPTTQYNSGFTYGDFAGNDDPVVNEAWNVLNQHQGSKPGEYSPVWQDEADAYLNQYQNRDPFSYDFNSDALYQQYKDNYIQQGQMAMMDTMGQAAAMTGGYGNSYAQAVGQQAYNLYMNQLNDIMPELYQMAHDRYTQEGQDMLAMYDLYMNKENYEYSKYQDVLNNWYQEDSRLQGNYDSAYDRAWNEHLMEYQKERDEIADQQWEKTYNLNASKAYSSSNSSSYSKETLEIQKELIAAGYDIALDGIWGNETEEAYKDYTLRNTPDGTGLTPIRQEEIEEWVVKACANANSASFDPRRVIKGSSWLTSDAEREYAYAVVDAMTKMN